MGARRLVIKANVVLPSDITRERYVDFCFRTHSVSVMSEHGEFMKSCPVAYNFCGTNEGFFYSLEIPKEPNQLGSRVLILYLEEQDMGIVIGCLPDGKNVPLDEEFQMKFMRRTEGNNFMFRGSGLRGVIDLIAQGDDGAGNRGQINLKAFNTDGTGQIEFATDFMVLKAKKSIKVTSNKILELFLKNKVEQDEFSKITWELGVGFTFEDEFENKITVNETGLKFVGKEGDFLEITDGVVKLNGNGQKAVLGNILQTQLNVEKTRVDTIIQAIFNAAVVPGDGGAAFKTNLLLALSFASPPDYSNILSDKVKLD